MFDLFDNFENKVVATLTFNKIKSVEQANLHGHLRVKTIEGDHMFVMLSLIRMRDK